MSNAPALILNAGLLTPKSNGFKLELKPEDVIPVSPAMAAIAIVAAKRLLKSPRSSNRPRALPSIHEYSSGIVSIEEHEAEVDCLYGLLMCVGLAATLLFCALIIVVSVYFKI